MLFSLSSIKGTALSRHRPFTELTRPASTFAGKNSGAFRFDSGKRKTPAQRLVQVDDHATWGSACDAEWRRDYGCSCGGSPSRVFRPPG